MNNFNRIIFMIVFIALLNPAEALKKSENALTNLESIRKTFTEIKKLSKEQQIQKIDELKKLLLDQPENKTETDLQISNDEIKFYKDAIKYREDNLETSIEKEKVAQKALVALKSKINSYNFWNPDNSSNHINMDEINALIDNDNPINDPNLRNGSGETLLIAAAHQNNTEAVEAIINSISDKIKRSDFIIIKNYSTKMSALSVAAVIRNLDIIKLIIDNVDPKDLPSLIETENVWGNSAFQLAVWSANSEIISYILWAYSKNPEDHKKLLNRISRNAGKSAIQCAKDMANGKDKNSEEVKFLNFIESQGKPDSARYNG